MTWWWVPAAPDWRRPMPPAHAAPGCCSMNARLALSVSDYGYILENGEIKLHGPADSLANDPKVREAYLGT